jgi:hypothetical protein
VELTVLRFERVLGEEKIQGVGFLQTDTGRPIYNVAWEKGECKKYDATNPSDLDGLGVSVLGEATVSEVVAPTPAPEPEQPQGDQAEGEGESGSEPVDEAAAIEAYLKEHGTDVTNKSVVEALKAQGIVIQSGQVTEAKNKLANQTVA